MTGARRLVTLLSLLALCSRSLGFPKGAPESACNSMMPIHRGALAQESDAPYQIFVSSGSGRIRLVMGSNSGEAYEGFIIMARDLETNEIIGEFGQATSNSSRHMQCTDGINNAMTQTHPHKMRNLEFDWEAPAEYEGEIKFNSTILKTFAEFWVGVESPRVSVSKRSIQVHSTTPTPLNLVPRSTTPPYYEPTTDDPNLGNSHPIYEECGTNKICFGWPENCIDERSCKMVVSVLVKGEQYIFDLMANSGAKYVAVGLSHDSLMGDDSVVECVDEGGKVGIHMSWNTGKKNNRIETPKGAMTPLMNKLEDGVITCRFSRDKNTTIEGMNFDLVNTPYHLLLVSGDLLKPDGSISYHSVNDVRRVAQSSEPRRLSDVSTLGAAGDLLVRLHGAFMMASWIGFASVGMLLARYYRQTWVNSQLCGKDQWFAWHRMFMLLTWILTIAAFIIIFIELGQWSSATYHASFGLATVVLCFIQPFMAAMRPHPGTSKRALFNWAHWFVGNAAHICGIIALFFAVGLSKAKLPDWVDWVLVAYVAFHVLTHFFLTFAGCASDKQGTQRVNSFPMKDVHARNSMTHPDARRDAPHSGLRKVTFLIYFLIVGLLAAALVLMIVFAPIEESWNTWMKKKTF